VTDIVTGGVLPGNACTKIIRYGGINTYLHVGVDMRSVIESDIQTENHRKKVSTIVGDVITPLLLTPAQKAAQAEDLDKLTWGAVK
jgi:hypothetical protein